MARLRAIKPQAYRKYGYIPVEKALANNTINMDTPQPKSLASMERINYCTYGGAMVWSVCVAAIKREEFVYTKYVVALMDEVSDEKLAQSQKLLRFSGRLEDFVIIRNVLRDRRCGHNISEADLHAFFHLALLLNGNVLKRVMDKVAPGLVVGNLDQLRNDLRTDIWKKMNESSAISNYSRPADLPEGKPDVESDSALKSNLLANELGSGMDCVYAIARSRNQRGTTTTTTSKTKCPKSGGKRK